MGLYRVRELVLVWPLLHGPYAFAALTVLARMRGIVSGRGWTYCCSTCGV